jgi:hypothetical protein
MAWNIGGLERFGVWRSMKKMRLTEQNNRSSYVNAQFWAVDGGLSGSHPTAPGKMA